MTVSKKSIKRFDIYWVDLNPTKGSELRKIRPCIIVSPDELNTVLATVIVVPLTSTCIDWPFRTIIHSTPKQSSAACDQIRTISKERLFRKAGTLSKGERTALVQILHELFAE